MSVIDAIRRVNITNHAVYEVIRLAARRASGFETLKRMQPEKLPDAAAGNFPA